MSNIKLPHDAHQSFAPRGRARGAVTLVAAACLALDKFRSAADAVAAARVDGAVCEEIAGHGVPPVKAAHRNGCGDTFVCIGEVVYESNAPTGVEGRQE